MALDNQTGFLRPSNLTGKDAPQYGGQVKIGNDVYWVSGWKHLDKEENVYLALRFKKNTTFHAAKSAKKGRVRDEC